MKEARILRYMRTAAFGAPIIMMPNGIGIRWVVDMQEDSN